jgi:hypothetical protein
MKYIEYKDSKTKFRALTGLSHEHFCELLPYFEEAHNACFNREQDRCNRFTHAL